MNSVVITWYKVPNRIPPRQAIYLTLIKNLPSGQRLPISYSFMPSVKLQKRHTGALKELYQNMLGLQPPSEIHTLIQTEPSPLEPHQFVEIWKLPGVFSGDIKYSHSLLRAAFREPIQNNQKMLVVGTGSGTDVLHLRSKLSVPILATDIDPRAVLNTEMNVFAHAIRDVQVVQTDLFDHLQGKYDWILFNAPRPIPLFYDLPRLDSLTITQRDLFERNLQSLSGTHYDVNGDLLFRLFRTLESVLAPSGRLLLMTDVRLYEVLPDDWKATQVTEPQMWGLNPNDGHFAIFRIERKAR